MMLPMRLRLLPLLALFSLLAACGTQTQGCTEKLWTGEFGLCMSEGWEKVSDEALKAEGVPMETVAAFHRTEEQGGQRDNIVVSTESLPGNVSAIAYAEVNIKVIEAI